MVENFKLSDVMKQEVKYPEYEKKNTDVLRQDNNIDAKVEQDKNILLYPILGLASSILILIAYLGSSEEPYVQYREEDGNYFHTLISAE